MIDPSKKYRTRDGREVKFLHRAPDGWPSQYTLRGKVGEMTVHWTDTGHSNLDGTPDGLDLIEVREPIEFPLVINNKGEPVSGVTLDPNFWDANYSREAPHRIARFREVIE